MPTDKKYLICPHCGCKNGYGATHFKGASNGDEKLIYCDNNLCYKKFMARIVMTVEFETETIDQSTKDEGVDANEIIVS